jgi:DNA-binding transcriptional LysR family regulator
VLSTFLPRYARRRPHVEIKLIEAFGPNLPATLERGEVHIGISVLDPIQSRNYPFEKLLLPPIEFVAACNQSFELGNGGSIDIRRLGSHPLLMLDTSFFVRTIFDSACHMADFKPNIRFESRTPHALLALAEGGYGVAVVPSVLPTHRYRLRIVHLMYRRKSLRLPYGIVWDSRRVLPAYAEDFCQSLAAYIRGVFPISRPAPSKVRSSRRHGILSNLRVRVG